MSSMTVILDHVILVAVAQGIYKVLDTFTDIMDIKRGDLPWRTIDAAFPVLDS